MILLPIGNAFARPANAPAICSNGIAKRSGMQHYAFSSTADAPLQ
jgi:hypothetical protein